MSNSTKGHAPSDVILFVHAFAFARCFDPSPGASNFPQALVDESISRALLNMDGEPIISADQERWNGWTEHGNGGDKGVDVDVE